MLWHRLSEKRWSRRRRKGKSFWTAGAFTDWQAEEEVDLKKKEKKQTFAGQIFPTWSALIAILPQGTKFKYPHGFKQIIIQRYSALTNSCTTGQSKRLCRCSRKKSFFLCRAVQMLGLPTCRLFSYYHWLCCHMLTGFRRPQQDPCLGWYEFYISFLLCNLNSRDEFAVLECVRGQEDSPSPCTVKACLLKNHRNTRFLFYPHTLSTVHAHIYSKIIPKFFLFASPHLNNVNVWTRKKKKCWPDRKTAAICMFA